MCKKSLRLTGSFCLALSLSCSQIARVTGLQNKDMPTVVTAVRGKIGIAHLPGNFTRKDYNRRFPGAVKIVTTLEYELRKSRGSAHELIMAMKDNLDEKGNPAISDNFFAVSVDGEFKTRTASAAEWQRAQVLTSVRQDEAVIGSPVTRAKDGSVSYDGKRYPMQSGCDPTETEAFLSPGKKWLAVMSDDSKPANRPGIPGFSGGGRTNARMYIDIYDTKSGEKILAARAPHTGCPACLFTNSVWVGDRYFIVSIDPPGDPPGEDRGSVGEDFFLALMPQESSAAVPLRSSETQNFVRRKTRTWELASQR